MQAHFKKIFIYTSIRLNKSTRVVIFLCSLFLLTHGAYSQTFKVQGSVTSNVNGTTVPVQYALVTFTDQNEPSKTFSAITDSSGKYALSIVTKVSPQPFVLPQSIELAQNYPNPFSTSTMISYQINKQSDVSIKIFDILGREVRAFTIGSQMLGTHYLIWDGKDNVGNKLASGIYFYQLRTGNETITKKMLFGLGGTNVSLPIPKTIPSYGIELKRENKAWSNGATAETFTVQIENLNCTTTPQIVTRQFDNITVHSDMTLNFVVVPAAAQPPSPVYPAPYGSPVWHPDGRIAFHWWKILKIELCLGAVNEKDIDWDSTGFWMIDPDGTGLQKLLSHGLDSPAWSSDGQWIAFGAVQIYKMKFTGTTFDTLTLTQLTFGGRNFLPAWSPDGQWIAYDSNNDSPNGMNFIWKMKADGSQKQRIAYEPTQGEIRMPYWSPDDKKIVHIRYMVGVSSSEIFIMDISGANPNRLTFNDVTDYYPKYSPDCTKIAFSSQTSGDVPQLWIMNADGTNLQQLTTSGAGSFSWSPDGLQIVYVHYDGRKVDVNNGTLWIMNADGSNKRQLTYNNDLVFEPWGR